MILSFSVSSLRFFFFLTWQRRLHFYVCLHKLWAHVTICPLDYYKVALTWFSVCDSLDPSGKKKKKQELIPRCTRKTFPVSFPSSKQSVKVNKQQSEK